MKKNLIYIFALMFALVGILSVNSVLATNVDENSSAAFGNVYDAKTTPAIPILLKETNLSVRFNITLNLTDTDAKNDTLNVSYIKITLPSQLELAGTPFNWGNATNVSLTVGNSTNSTPEDLNQLGTLFNFTNTSKQILIWTNKTLGGANLSSKTSLGRTLTNLSVIFNVSVLSSSTADLPIYIDVIYAKGNDSVWNRTATLYIHTVNMFTATNLTELEFNEDAATTITLNINNSNIANFMSTTTTTINTSIRNISVELSSSYLSIIEGVGNDSSAPSAKSKYNFTTRANATQIFWNSSVTDGLINASKNATFTFKVTAAQPGNYTILVKMYNNQSTTNITTLTSTLQIKDATVPANITLTCTPTIIYLGETETCTCTAQDNYYTTSNGLSTSIDTIETSSTGTHTQTCTAIDGNANSATATTTFYVNAQSQTTTAGGSGGAGSGYTGATTHNVGTLSTTEKTTASEAEENIKFTTSSGTTAGTIFVGTIDEVTADEVTITIQLTSGSNKEVTISSGSTGKVDLDADGMYDVAITLSSISSGKASLALKEISETVPASETTEEETEETGGVAEKAVEAIKNLTWLWVTLGIIVVIAGIIFYLTQKKGPVGVFLITLFSKSGGRSFRKK